VHIFYCAGGKFGEVEGGHWCWHYRTLVQSVRCGVSLWCRCAEYTGRTGVSPVLSVRCAGGLATLSAHESGEPRTLRVRPVARVRWILVGTEPVLECVLAILFSGRVWTETMLTKRSAGRTCVDGKEDRVLYTQKPANNPRLKEDIYH